MRAKQLERSKDAGQAKVFVAPYLGSSPLSWRDDGGMRCGASAVRMLHAQRCELQERGEQPSSFTSAEMGKREPVAVKLHTQQRDNHQ